MLTAIAVAGPEDVAPAAPIATVRLERPGPFVVTRFLDRLDARLAGPGASTLFRDEVSLMVCHWTIASRGGDGLILDREREEDVLEVLAVASGMAADDVLGEALADPDDPTAARKSLITTVTHPTLTLSTPRGAKVRVGSTVQVRSIEEGDDLPLADASLTLSGNNRFVDAWRVSGLVTQRQWSAGVRQGVLPNLALSVAARSHPESALPGRIVLGASTDVTDRWELRGWVSGTESGAGWQAPVAGAGIELRADWDWDVPGAWIGDRQ
jgi:hypothetical protein